MHHRLSSSFPGVPLPAEASVGLLLVFGGWEEKRPPKTRDNCRPLLFPVEVENSEGSSGVIDVGKSMICSDIWHKYHE